MFDLTIINGKIQNLENLKSTRHPFYKYYMYIFKYSIGYIDTYITDKVIYFVDKTFLTDEELYMYINSYESTSKILLSYKQRKFFNFCGSTGHIYVHHTYNSCYCLAECNNEGIYTFYDFVNFE